MKIIAPAALLILLAGCGGSTAPPPVVRAAPIPVPQPGMSALTTVMGASANALIGQFGRPQLDISEGRARKLQFAGPICVLDAYLYPKGSEAPRVTYLDAREPDGSTIDRASCVAALTRRDGGK